MMVKHEDKTKELECFIAEHGALGEALLDMLDDDLEEAQSWMRLYYGSYDSEETFMCKCISDMVSILMVVFRLLGRCLSVGYFEERSLGCQ